MRRILARCAGVLLLSCAAASAHGQEASDGSNEASQDVATVVALPAAGEQIDERSVLMPDLSFTPDARYEKDFDKYYYFHREHTTFVEALADLRDCDGLARGLSSPFGNMPTPYPYAGTLAGVAGGAIANLMVSAIFGSAQVRAARRINMRRCMNYKGYQRYGLPKEKWEPFNFEEGFSELGEQRRQTFLMQQAKVASSSTPMTKALGR